MAFCSLTRLPLAWIPSLLSLLLISKSAGRAARALGEPHRALRYAAGPARDAGPAECPSRLRGRLRGSEAGAAGGVYGGDSTLQEAQRGGEIVRYRQEMQRPCRNIV